MNDGRTHLACKPEHAVDLDTGAVVAAAIHPADEGDTTTWRAPSRPAAGGLEAAGAAPDAEAPTDLVADQGYHSRAVLKDLDGGPWRSRIAEPSPRTSCAGMVISKRGERCKATAPGSVGGRQGCRQAVRRTGRAELRAHPRPRSPPADHLRGRENVQKRYLVHVAGFNPGLVLRLLLGAGTPKELAARVGLLFWLIDPTAGLVVLLVMPLEPSPTRFSTRCYRAGALDAPKRHFEDACHTLAPMRAGQPRRARLIMSPEPRRRFLGDLGRPVPIPPEAIRGAVAVLESGRLHRYGESASGDGEVAAFERAFAAMIGAPYALAVNSGGCALFLALRAAGIRAGEPVLTNAFTLAPVPGAIAHAGAQPVLVETTRALTVDLDDLERKIAGSGARTFLISHMRGHLADMDRVAELCRHHDVLLIEDCAHTLGASWNGTPSGRFGRVACFSTQSYKHLNAGEGGVLTSDDPELAARATILSGSYMFYEAHGASPDLRHFADARFMMPNCSMRMSELSAAVLRPQLAHLPDWISSWNRSYRHLERRIGDLPHLEVPDRPAAESYVGSSIQFFVSGVTPDQMARFLADADQHGVHVKWFGGAEPVGYTSRHASWRYIGPAAPMPETDRILDGLCDLRVPVGLSEDECALVADVLGEAMHAALAER